MMLYQRQPQGIAPTMNNDKKQFVGVPLVGTRDKNKTISYIKEILNKNRFF